MPNHDDLIIFLMHACAIIMVRLVLELGDKASKRHACLQRLSSKHYYSIMEFKSEGRFTFQVIILCTDLHIRFKCLMENSVMLDLHACKTIVVVHSYRHKIICNFVPDHWYQLPHADKTLYIIVVHIYTAFLSNCDLFP